MEFAVLAGERDPLFFRQRFSHLTQPGEKRVKSPNYGPVLRVLERSEPVHVLVDDDCFAAFRQCLKKHGQCRLVLQSRFYVELLFAPVE